MTQPDERSAKFIKMTTSPVEKLVCSLAVPNIAIMMVTALYNTADTYFVGYLSTSAVAAVGISLPMMTIIQAIGFFFGIGSGNYISRILGAQETEKASRMAATAFLSGFLIMAVIAAACFVFLESFIVLLGATPTIVPYAVDYLLYILIASPWMVGATILNQQLRFQGSPNIAMIGILSGAILNIFLDPLFIFVFKLGIAGAAQATMLSQVVSFVILLIFSRRKGNLVIRIKHFSPSPSMYYEMFRGGIPSLLRQSLTSFTAVVINHFAGGYGDSAIAAISIVNRLYQFSNSVMMGFGQGFQPVCGFNYGANLYGRVKKSFWFCVRFAFCSLSLIAAVMIIFAPQIITAFRKDDPEVIRIGVLGLRLHCLSLPFSSWVIMSNMMMQSTGKALFASLVSLSRQGLFLLPALFLLTRAIPLGLLGIQVSLPVADLSGFLLAIPLALSVLRQMKTDDAALSKE
jgi:putative MATE family efflux protein